MSIPIPRTNPICFCCLSSLTCVLISLLSTYQLHLTLSIYKRIPMYCIDLNLIYLCRLVWSFLPYVVDLHATPHFTYLLLHILNYIYWKYELAVVHQCLFQSAAVPVSWGDLNINHHLSYFSSSYLSQAFPLPLCHLWTRRVAYSDITRQIIQVESLFSKLFASLLWR